MAETSDANLNTLLASVMNAQTPVAANDTAAPLSMIAPSPAIPPVYWGGYSGRTLAVVPFWGGTLSLVYNPYNPYYAYNPYPTQLAAPSVPATEPTVGLTTLDSLTALLSSSQQPSAAQGNSIENALAALVSQPAAPNVAADAGNNGYTLAQYLSGAYTNPVDTVSASAPLTLADYLNQNGGQSVAVTGSTAGVTLASLLNSMVENTSSFTVPALNGTLAANQNSAAQQTLEQLLLAAS
jgi:hypothetical protein